MAARIFRTLGLTIPTGYSSNGSAANRAAAGQDADSLLVKVRLPAGATELTAEPSGDHAYLKPMPTLEGDGAHAVASRWWRVPGTPSQMIAFVKAHPPAGAKQVGGGSSGNPRTGTSALSVYFHWPSVPGVLGERTAAVTATKLPNGDSGVLVESQTDWVVLRPSTERIPSMARGIKITSTAAGQPAIGLPVTAPSRVRAIVRLINSLPIAQPITYACPAEIDPRLIKISFQGSGGASVTVLTYVDFRPWLSPSVGCKSIGLTIAGRPQPPLLGGGFLHTLTALVGRSLL